MTADAFAAALAHTLARRARMLKLLSMNHYDMEANSRMENLVAFKRSYGAAMQAVTQCVEKFFPHISEEAVQGFLYAFFPFLFGLYPYAYVTDKQKAAMEQADRQTLMAILPEDVRAAFGEDDGPQEPRTK